MTTNGTDFVLNGEILKLSGSNDYFLIFSWAQPSQAGTKNFLLLYSSLYLLHLSKIPCKKGSLRSMNVLAWCKAD